MTPLVETGSAALPCSNLRHETMEPRFDFVHMVKSETRRTVDRLVDTITGLALELIERLFY